MDGIADIRIESATAGSLDRSLIRANDLRLLRQLSYYAAVARLRPVEKWEPAVRRVQAAERGSMGRVRRRYARGVRAVLDPTVSDAEIEAMFQDYRLAMHRRIVAAVASRARPDWRPRFAVDGEARLKDALASGRGVILWVDYFVPYTIMSKWALADAGYRLHQLSARGHGLSPSRFGQAVLNPIQVAAENRHLAERIVIDTDDLIRPLRRLRRLLSENRIIMVTNNTSFARRLAHLRLGRAGHLMLATGTITLAARTGAALIPVETVEEDPFRSYRIRLAAPLPVPSGAPDDVEIARVARAYADYFLPILLARRADWRIWTYLREWREDR